MTFLNVFLKNDYEFIDIFDTSIIITIWLLFFYFIRKTEAMKIVVGLFILFVAGIFGECLAEGWDKGCNI